MSVDVFLVIKVFWYILSGAAIVVSKVAYSNYKDTKGRLDSLEKDIIKVKAEMVTKEKLDDILDKKIKAVRDDVLELRREIKNDFSELRGELNKQLSLLIDKK